MADAEGPQPANVQPAEAVELVKEGYTLLDVRWMRLHDPGAAWSSATAAAVPAPPRALQRRRLSPRARASLLRRTPEEYAQGHAEGSINVPVKLDDGQGGMTRNPDFLQQARRGALHELLITCWSVQQATTLSCDAPSPADASALPPSTLHD